MVVTNNRAEQGKDFFMAIKIISNLRNNEDKMSCELLRTYFAFLLRTFSVLVVHGYPFFVTHVFYCTAVGFCEKDSALQILMLFIVFLVAPA